MALAEKEDIERFVEDIRDLFGERIENIILFGSYARDEHVPGSDIDILVVLDEVEGEDRKRAGRIAGEYFLDEDLNFSPTLVARKEFEEKLENGYSFHEEVEEEGVRL